MLDRRSFMKTCSEMGLLGTLFPGVLWAQAQVHAAKKITKEMVESGVVVADVPIAEEYKEMMLENLNNQAKRYEEIYKLHIPNSVDPALIFDPVLPGMRFETERKPIRMSKAANAATASAPKNLEDLAFASARELGELVRAKDRKSTRLNSSHLVISYAVFCLKQQTKLPSRSVDRTVAIAHHLTPTYPRVPIGL